ncbi:MAG: HlyD family efflux transporter periplasmic adaptor subunit [Bacteroidota bacterium]
MKQLVPFVKVLTAIAMSVFMASCSATLPDESSSAEAVSVEEKAAVVLVKKEDLSLLEVKNSPRKQSSLISGRVIPRNTTQLFAEVQGKIKPSKRSFKAGSNFRKGEPLIEIERKEFELSLESQRAALLNVLTGILPDIKSDYATSYEQWLDYVKTYDFGQTLASLPDPKSYEEKFFLTSNQVYSLYYQIKSLEERLDKYTIVAPYTGTITATTVDVGSLVSPGQALGTISNRMHYELEAGMPLSIANQLQIGDQVTFKSNEIAGTWTGRVVRINNLIDPSTQNIPVYFSLQGKGLRAGMYLEGEIATNKTAAVTAIPNAALSRDESVLILEKDVITRKNVQPIDFLTDSILVKGLNDSDLVILNQFDIPMEGSKVGM